MAATPVYRVAGARSASASAATISPAKPTVDSQKGLLLALVTSKNNATHSCSTGGWTQLGTQVNSGASFTASLWVADESAGAPTFTWTGAAACAAQIVYYSDADNTMFIGSSVIGTASTGTTNPHTSAAITTDVNNALAIYVDAVATNTGLNSPGSGWTQDLLSNSGTDGGAFAFGSKVVATSGSSSGAISTNGGVAAWVQWQIELKGSAANAGFEVSKAEVVTWTEPPAGFDIAKAESAAWTEPPAGYDVSKAEMVAWTEQPGLHVSKLEAGVWAEPASAVSVSKLETGAWVELNDFRIAQLEVGAWLDGATSGSRRMSLM